MPPTKGTYPPTLVQRRDPAQRLAATDAADDASMRAMPFQRALEEACVTESHCSLAHLTSASDDGAARLPLLRVRAGCP